MARSAVAAVLLIALGNHPESDLIDRRLLRQEICLASEQAEQLIDELSATPRPERWPLLTSLGSATAGEKGPLLEGATVMAVGEVYCEQRALLASIILAPVDGLGVIALSETTLFQREGTDWKAVQGSDQEAAGVCSESAVPAPRVQRWSGLALERFPAFLHAVGREQPERFRLARIKGDVALCARIIEETLVGFSLKRLEDTLRVLQEKAEPLDLVRVAEQKIDGDRAIVKFEILKGGEWSTEKLVLVKEGDGWVILEPYSSAGQRTMSSVRSLATAVEAFAIDNDAYPSASSVEGLAATLVPTYLTSLPVADAWGIPLRYTVSSDGQSYRIESAGSDRKFQPENARRQGGKSANTADDLVYQNGQFLSWWEDDD